MTLTGGCAARFPEWLWKGLDLAAPDFTRPAPEQERGDRLDTRLWFTTIAAP